MAIAWQGSQIATSEDIKRPWMGGKNGIYFRCYLCGHKFQDGDQFRLVFSKHYGNPLVCKECDGTNEDVLDKWESLNKELVEIEKKFWWYFKRFKP